MRLEDRRPHARFGSAARYVLLGLLVSAAVGVPLRLYLTRGRKLPLTVLVVAERSAVAAGQEVTIASRLRPAHMPVERRWFGPGVPTSEPQPAGFRWRAPREPGVYTLRLRVRRSGSFAEDAASVRVVARAPAELPLLRPRDAVALAGATCAPERTAALKTALVLVAHGRVCAGERIVAELRRGAAASELGPAWLGWAAGSLREGRLRELWVPTSAALRTAPRATPGSAPAATTLRARLLDREQRCVHELQQPLPASAACGASAAVAADFGWQLRGPGDFVLLAKPPRPPASAVYQWDLGDGQLRMTNRASLPYRYAGKPQRYRIVHLTVQVGSERASTLRLLVDRTVTTP